MNERRGGTGAESTALCAPEEGEGKGTGSGFFFVVEGPSPKSWRGGKREEKGIVASRRHSSKLKSTIAKGKRGKKVGHAAFPRRRQQLGTPSGTGRGGGRKERENQKCQPQPNALRTKRRKNIES